LSQSFRLPNFPDINLEDVTNLTADAASGQNVINVIGTAGMNSGDIGLLGEPGSLVGEFVTIDTLDTTSITFIGNLINLHRQTEPYTNVFGDQIKCYRTLNVNNYPPSDDDFAANPFGSPLNIDQDSPISLFTDLAGGAQHWYKFVYLNSITLSETALAASKAIRGGSSINHYCSIEDIRREAGILNANQIQDTQIALRRDQAESQVDGALLAAGYTLPMTDAMDNPYIPAMVSNATRLLGASFVLLQDYGPVAGTDTKDGDSKNKQAMAIIKGIQDHTLILVDANKQEMSTNSRIRGTPDSNTAYVGNDILRGSPPEPAMFSISRKF
jgi:hypothetical protein